MGSIYKISTDLEANYGLFQTTLMIETIGVTTANAGNYRCLFTSEKGDTYHSEGELVVRLLTINPFDERIYSYSNAGLTLSCTLDASDSEFTLTWTGPDGVIDASKYRLDKKNPNVHILSLANTASNGQYKCKFFFVEGSSTSPEGIFRDVNMNLVEMVSPSVLYSTYGVGIVVTLTCQVDSSSKLRLYFHDGSRDLESSTLVYDNRKTIAQYEITVDHANKDGIFQCRKSEAEFSKTSTILTVFSINPPLSSVTKGDIGESVTLTCTAGFHADVIVPVISWWRDSYLAIEARKTVIVAKDSSSLTSKLPIIISSDNDGSVYKCVAEYRGLAAGMSLDSSTTIIMAKDWDEGLSVLYTQS